MQRKKFMTLVLMLAVLLSGFMFTACGVNEIEELLVVGNVYSEFVVGENYDYSNITVKVTFNDDEKSTQTIKANDPRVSVSGFSTETAGSRTMTITFKDDKSGSTATCDLGYTVYKNEQTIRSASDIDKITNQTDLNDSGKLFFPADMTIDMTGYTINRPLELTARQGVKVILKNVKINNTSSDFRTFTFNNVIITNATEGTSTNALTASGNKIVLNINKCVILANGTCGTGINLSASTLTVGKFNIVGSEFQTPNNGDILTNMIYFNPKRNLETEILIKDNIMTCNFSYGLHSVYNATIENNYVDATLTSTGIGDIAASATSQKYFTVRKNPAFIHCNIGESTTVSAAKTSNSKVFLTAKNNDVRNVQNFLRVYGLDKFDYDTQLNFTFTGNKLTNVAALVNTSSQSYVSLSKILADLHKDINSGYNKEYKAVITKDTEISIKEGMSCEYITRTGTYLYYDFDEENTNRAKMSIGGEALIYVAYAARLTDLHAAECWIIKSIDEEKYYVITAIDYSPNGDIQYFMSENGVTKSLSGAKAFDQAQIKLLLGIGE